MHEPSARSQQSIVFVGDTGRLEVELLPGENGPELVTTVTGRDRDPVTSTQPASPASGFLKVATKWTAAIHGEAAPFVGATNAANVRAVLDLVGAQLALERDLSSELEPYLRSRAKLPRPVATRRHRDRPPAQPPPADPHEDEPHEDEPHADEPHEIAPGRATPLRVGLIGAGGLPHTIVPILQQLDEGVEIVAVFDVDAGRAATLAAQLPIVPSPSLEALLATQR